jgi:hypothetical protein
MPVRASPDSKLQRMFKRDFLLLQRALVVEPDLQTCPVYTGT